MNPACTADIERQDNADHALPPGAPGLNHQTPAMLSLAMTAAQGQAPAVKMHTKTCLRAGWTQ